MAKQPLAEVFGYPITNQSDDAKHHRDHRLCPFGNKVPNCTKSKANDPLGVCSVFDDGKPSITCPVRFMERSRVVADAADFFFKPKTKWTTLTEVRLPDKDGKSAGNIDVVLVAYDDAGTVIDFGALEIQAVYISGNVTEPFKHYMSDPIGNQAMDWSKRPKYPSPDYLSSSRKRLAPQLLFKGGILRAWNKKIAVAVQNHFFATLPRIASVQPEQSDLAWLVYDLDFNKSANRYALNLKSPVYSKFTDCIKVITQSSAGPLESFIETLQVQLDEKLENGNAPETKTIDSPI